MQETDVDQKIEIYQMSAYCKVAETTANIISVKEEDEFHQGCTTLFKEEYNNPRF